MWRAIAFAAVLCGGMISLVGVGIALAAHVKQESVSKVLKKGNPAGQAIPPGVGGRLSCGRLKKSLLVFDQPTKEMLFGPEWIPGSAPLGEPGNTVVAAHRDTHFRFLKDVRVGDRFELQLAGKNLVYKVQKLTIVAKTDTRLLEERGTNVLTLVTCYPFYYIGHAPKRFIVTAALMDTRLENSSSSIKMQASGGN